MAEAARKKETLLCEKDMGFVKTFPFFTTSETPSKPLSPFPLSTLRLYYGSLYPVYFELGVLKYSITYEIFQVEYCLYIHVGIRNHMFLLTYFEGTNCLLIYLKLLMCR